jgi:hypothetical protein
MSIFCKIGKIRIKRMDTSSDFHQILLKTYDEIHKKNQPKQQHTLLLEQEEFCKALWTEGSFVSHNSSLSTLYEDLRQFESKGILYIDSTTPSTSFEGQKGKGRLHWTVFQTKTFPVEKTGMTNEDIETAKILKDLTGSIPPFQIAFCGIRKTKFGIFLCGFPTPSCISINSLRDSIRSSLSDINEPHPQDICHATLFRFREEPTYEDIESINTLCEKYKNTFFCTFTPKKYLYGYATWTMISPSPFTEWEAPPPIWILHRGLYNGPDTMLENQESILQKRLDEGWHVEIDVWQKENQIFLGHDSPVHKLQNLSILSHPRSWIHAKNLEAASYCLENSLHCFVHDSDIATITSKRYLWCFPGFSAGSSSIVVLPERSYVKNMFTCAGVCSDYKPSFFTTLYFSS